MLHERAFVGSYAAFARRDGGLPGAGSRGLGGRQPLGNPGLQGHHFAGHVLLHQQTPVVTVTLVDELVVDMRQRHAPEFQAGTPGYPGLDCTIGEMLRLQGGGGLHLDGLGARRIPQEHVEADEDTLMLEGGLIDRPGIVWIGQQLRRARDCGAETAVVLEQMPCPMHGTVEFLRQLAHSMPLAERSLGAGRDPGKPWLVDFQPQPSLALERRHDPGFREAGRHALMPRKRT